jgi:flagellar FliL protein
MAEDAQQDGNQAGEAESAPDKNEQNRAPDKKGSLLKIILLIGFPILLIGVVIAVLFFTSFGRQLIKLDVPQATAPQEAVQKLPENIVYYDMPELLVNIQSSSGNRKPFLRLAVKFEVHDLSVIPTLDLIKPRITDAFQIYLRELRVEDLDGASGSQRLKEELLKRVNAVAAPIKINDVLFQVFVVQ